MSAWVRLPVIAWQDRQKTEMSHISEEARDER
jgi:hypothetical protein